MAKLAAPRLLTPAQELLVAKWMPLARKLVAKCEGATDPDELLSKAMWGLCKFARLYDPSRGYSEQALATRAIGTGLLDAHRSAKRHLANVELEDHHLGQAPEQELLPPARAWISPPDPVERRVRAAGMSERSLQTRAREQGYGRPQGRPQALDGQSLLRILDSDPRIKTAELARRLGLSDRMFRAEQNRKLLARCREMARRAYIGHVQATDRTPGQGKSPSIGAAQSWG